MSSNTQSPFHGLVVEENPLLEVTAQEKTLQQDLELHMQHYNALPEQCDAVEKSTLMLDIAECHLGLDQPEEAHQWAHRGIPPLIQNEQWPLVVDACDIIYNCSKEDALIALGNGIWLAVTFPIDPNISIQMLHHIVDETPDDSDGAAVAAMLAHFLAETRSNEKDHTNLTFLTNQIVTQVAKRHRNIEDEKTLQTWIKMYQLDEIDQLLSKMAIMLETIVENNWWYDRDDIRSRLPVN